MSNFSQQLTQKPAYFMEQKLPQHITSFRKSHGTQHFISIMLEKWKNALENDEKICIFFIDLYRSLM